MTPRVLLRRGTGTAPPLELAPGELAYSPDDGRLWLGGFTGEPGVSYTPPAPGVGTATTPGLLYPDGTTIIADPSGKLSALGAVGSGQTALQVQAAIDATLAGALVFDGGTF